MINSVDTGMECFKAFVREFWLPIVIMAVVVVAAIVGLSLFVTMITGNHRVAVAERTTFDGHTYIVLGNKNGMTHDPDCKCHRKEDK